MLTSAELLVALPGSVLTHSVADEHPPISRNNGEHTANIQLIKVHIQSLVGTLARPS